ncbi:acyl-CoA thioesterase [Luteimonas aquatica]|uniref:acyl-CoA thioesterase n=1 Tax=Luteimonas aquatica TaxID=450364 RepID=UPI001F58D106|nr:thioesterase family protein [Luteimonas aquatica]
MFMTKRRIRFGDCDPGGVIYAPRLGYFVVEAVLDFLSDRLGGPAEREIMKMGVLPPARALSIEFLSPLEWDADVEIRVSVRELRTHAIAYAVVGKLASGETAFLAELTQVCVSPETRRPVAVPEALRRALGGSVDA